MSTKSLQTHFVSIVYLANIRRIPGFSIPVRVFAKSRALDFQKCFHNKAVIVENIAKVNKYAEFYYLGDIFAEIIVLFT